MSKDDFPQRFERAYVALVSERATLRGYKKGEFAAKLWPWMKPKVAATRWNAIREKAVHTGKRNHCGRPSHGGRLGRGCWLSYGNCKRKRQKGVLWRRQEGVMYGTAKQA